MPSKTEALPTPEAASVELQASTSQRLLSPEAGQSHPRQARAGRTSERTCERTRRWIERCVWFCCLYRLNSEKKKPEDLIVDVAEILKEKAWGKFHSKKGVLQKMMLKRKNFDIEVPENYFIFEDITPTEWITIKSSEDKNASTSTAANIVNDNGDAGQTDFDLFKEEKNAAARKLISPEYLSMDTEFRNETTEKQKYTVRFEKTRRTEIYVTFQKGVTIGGKAQFSLKFPYVEAMAEAERRYEVTKSDGQKFEDAVVMEATSDFEVGPNRCHTANIQLEERNLQATFKIISRMSLPQGCVPIYIKRKSDGRKVFTYYVYNIKDQFKEFSCAQIVKKKNDEDQMEEVDDQIDFVTEGVVKCCNHKLTFTRSESEDVKNQA